ncbi:haloacid dehalogenase type II [Variovorax sp. dw_954]|uniref:haloacid dehalogenase type II n=1 Tax=Variovorax sp. dw_954 TaxID=2720078 RepID=UPI001BD6210C
MKHIEGIVFDLYGTLFDVHSVAARCEELYAGRGSEISMLWRQKQLEYTWLRSLMGQFVDFEKCTEDALVFTCAQLGLQLGAGQRRMLCDEYLRLQPFTEVPVALQALNALGVPLAILSNGSRHSIDAVVRNAGLQDAFAHLLSVDEVQVFKPDMRVYSLAERKLGVARADILFVSSNAWDVTGARCFGFETAWIDRRGGTFDEMGQRPDHVLGGLDKLVHLLSHTDVPGLQDRGA